MLKIRITRELICPLIWIEVGPFRGIKEKVTRGNLLAFVLKDLRLLLCYNYIKFLMLVFRQKNILVNTLRK